jgi:OOP family OmpA-OmpF porin
MFSRKSFRPFLLLGAGVERDKANLNVIGERRKNSPYASAGLGFQADLSERVALQADIRNVHGFMRGDVFPNSKSNNYYATVGLNIAFNAPPRPAPPPPPPRTAAVEPPPPPPVAGPPPPPPPARFEKVTMSATELFDFDSAKLTADTPKLDEIAAALNANTKHRQRGHHRLCRPPGQRQIQPETVRAPRQRGQGIPGQQRHRRQPPERPKAKAKPILSSLATTRNVPT